MEDKLPINMHGAPCYHLKLSWPSCAGGVTAVDKQQAKEENKKYEETMSFLSQVPLFMRQHTRTSRSTEKVPLTRVSSYFWICTGGLGSKSCLLWPGPLTFVYLYIHIC